MSTALVHAKRIKGILLAIGVLILSCILALFVLNRQSDLPAPPDISTEERKATISISGMVHTDILDGTIERLLEAQSALIYRDENISQLHDLKATFFNEDGKPTYLAARSGIWRMASNDLEVSGDVVLKNEQYEIKTETLTYNDEKRVFETQSPVVIVGPVITHRAGWMIYNLDSNMIDFGANVNSNLKGEF